jgi:hypothetical protein
VQNAIKKTSLSIEALQGYIEQNADKRASIASIVHPLESYGGLQKITDRPTLVAAASSFIIALISVFMQKTTPLSCFVLCVMSCFKIVFLVLMQQKPSLAIKKSSMNSAVFFLLRRCNGLSISPLLVDSITTGSKCYIMRKSWNGINGEFCHLGHLFRELLMSSIALART